MKRIITPALLLSATLCASGLSHADARTQALQIHNRIAGVPPSTETLLTMADAIDDGRVADAVRTAMEDENFYRVTLKNMATPWTNRDQDVFAPLNDYTATFIGMVRDGTDLRTLLYDDILYTSNAPGLPAYSIHNNDHYAALEASDHSLRDTLEPQTQSSLTGLPSYASSGVLTSRAGARAFFFAGTNRAMFRFTLMSHLCRDLEQVHDNSLPPDRIRQDVSRSPGGDSRVFNNNCAGCHTGMDPMAQAFAYYDWIYDSDADPEGARGHIIYNPEGHEDPDTGSRVTPKHRINSTTFAPGYVITDDRWDNYWRSGMNANLGWDPALPGSGEGARSMAMELAHSEAFAACQVEKVFRSVCARAPESSADRSLLGETTERFMHGSDAYNLQPVFIDTASYCTAP
ncbi:hypothetical protein [Marinimicrobium alkaliphilum]|uniref:hypothetical protein n=1 Tax=Marinimicrobium alkaliphilum TaxID=2202654 RepID=UPI001E35E322|nr:hypothetical protein [Marinimicrobium alkaliphilum]